MRSDLLPAIDAFKEEVASLESQLSATKAATNRLCALAGVPAVYADIAKPDAGVSTTIRADRFYGKGMTTAAREYLEIRGASDRGPASPREIYDGLVAGGFQFDTSIELNRLAGLRNALRKNSSIFHRLPNNQYGLLTWYPKAKAAPVEEREETPPKRVRRANRAAGPAPKPPHTYAARPQKQRRASGNRKPRSEDSAELTAFVVKTMQDGEGWTLERLKQAAILMGVKGIDAATKLPRFQGTLLALRSQKRVSKAGDEWKMINTETTLPADAGAVVHPFKAA